MNKQSLMLYLDGVIKEAQTRIDATLEEANAWHTDITTRIGLYTDIHTLKNVKYDMNTLLQEIRIAEDTSNGEAIHNRIRSLLYRYESKRDAASVRFNTEGVIQIRLIASYEFTTYSDIARHVLQLLYNGEFQ